MSRWPRRGSRRGSCVVSLRGRGSEIVFVEAHPFCGGLFPAAILCPHAQTYTRTDVQYRHAVRIAFHMVVDRRFEAAYPKCGESAVSQGGFSPFPLAPIPT